MKCMTCEKEGDWEVDTVSPEGSIFSSIGPICSPECFDQEAKELLFDSKALFNPEGE